MEIYIDGKYYKKDEAKISVFDHGLLYGDGIFEGIRIYSRRIFKLEEHLERLYRSAKVLRLGIQHTPEEMKKLVEEVVDRNEVEDGYIRLLVTRGKGDLGIDPDNCSRPSLVIIVADIQLYPASLYEQGIRVITSSLRRQTADTLDPRMKSLNYLNNIMAKLETKQAGCQEAVMLNREGYVTECTGDNIFILKEGVLLTPAAHLGLLGGITRETVLTLARESGLPVQEAYLTCYDLYTAEECFLTGTGAEIIPVVTIDGRNIGNGKPGPQTARLRMAFKELVTRA